MPFCAVFNAHQWFFDDIRGFGRHSLKHNRNAANVKGYKSGDEIISGRWHVSLTILTSSNIPLHIIRLQARQFPLIILRWPSAKVATTLFNRPRPLSSVHDNRFNPETIWEMVVAKSIVDM